MSRVSSSCYGDWKYDAGRIRAVVKRLAEVLPRVMAEVRADFVAVRGTSGSWLVGPLLMQDSTQHIPFVLVRKENEMSHGSAVESSAQIAAQINKPGARFLILDDFICSGDTVRAINDRLHAAGFVLAGVLCHEHASTTARDPLVTRDILGAPVYAFPY